MPDDDVVSGIDPPVTNPAAEYRCGAHGSIVRRLYDGPGRFEYRCDAGHLHGGGRDESALDLGLVRPTDTTPETPCSSP